MQRRRGVTLAILCFCAMHCAAQDTTNTLTDGFTPPAVAAGTPAESYVLSKFETVNVYNGGLNFNLPLYRIGGRGAAQFTIGLSIERKWRIEQHLNGPTTIYIPATANAPGEPFWGSTPFPRYTPGTMVRRQVVDPLGGTYKCTFPDFPGSGYTFQNGKTLTRLTFVDATGTDHEFVDALTGGKITDDQNYLCPTDPNTGGQRRGRVFTTLDSSAMTFIADADVYDAITASTFTMTKSRPVSGVLLFPDGTRYQITSDGLVQTITDRNGNTITFNHTPPPSAPAGTTFTIVDSLGREIDVALADLLNTFTDTISFRGAGGTQRAIQVNYALMQGLLPSGQTPQTVNVLIPATNASTTTTFNPYLVSSVVAQDGSSYGFQYNVYGEMTRITLPTGAAFEYDYPSSMPNMVDSCPDPYACIFTVSQSDTVHREMYRRIKERRVLPDGVTVEQRTVFTPTYGSSTTMVTIDHKDIAGNSLGQDKHYFFGDLSSPATFSGPPDNFYSDGFQGKEYMTEEFGPGGAPALRKVKNLWGALPCPTGDLTCTANTTLPGSTHNPNVCQTLTILEDAAPVQTSGQVSYFDQYSNRTDLYEYDFGAAPPDSVSCPASAPAAYKRHTTTAFLTGGYDTYSTASPIASTHIRNLPTQVTSYDSSGTLAAQTNSYYDGSSVQQASGATGHDDTNFGTSLTMRGNLTSVQRTVGGGAPLIAAGRTYDMLGNALTFTDGNNNLYRHSYADSFSAGAPPAGLTTYAFPSTITYPLVPASSTAFQATVQYDYYLGRPTGYTGLDNIPSSFTYDTAANHMDRPTQVIIGTSPQTQKTFAYCDVGSGIPCHTENSVTTTSDLNTSGDNVLKTVVEYDALGRDTETRSYENATPTGYIVVQKQRDGLGRVNKASNPFRPGDTVYWTTTQFDGLSRVTSVTTPAPNGASTTTSYQGNTTTVQDPAVNKRTSITDALGRLTQVTEDPGALGIQHLLQLRRAGRPDARVPERR